MKVLHLTETRIASVHEQTDARFLMKHLRRQTGVSFAARYQ